MNPEQMKQRTKRYAIRIVNLVEALPNTRTCNRLGQQLLDCGTSVGANYRAVCRAKSNADFINKLKIVEEECDESLFWMEVLVESGKMKLARIRDLMDEGEQILAIVVASAKTARGSTDFPQRQAQPLNSTAQDWHAVGRPESRPHRQARKPALQNRREMRVRMLIASIQL